MIIGAGTSKKLQLVTGSAASIRPHVSYVVVDAGTPPVVQNVDGDFIAAIASATTTDIKAGVVTNKTRIDKLSVFNAHASQACLCTLQLVDGSNTEIVYQTTLLAGESFYYTGASFIHYDVNGVPYAQTAKLDAKLRVAADVTNATTSFADITGLTVALISGRKYCFEVMLIHQTNATTTGAQFAVNIGAAPTSLILHEIAQITASAVTASATLPIAASVTAVDTTPIAETTGPGAVNMIALMYGSIVPSADGTFAVRSKSEIAVAGGLVIKAGSWCRIWEADN